MGQGDDAVMLAPVMISIRARWGEVLDKDLGSVMYAELGGREKSDMM